LETAPIPRRPAPSDLVRLSFAQRQLWILDQLVPGSPFYKNLAALRLVGLLDEDALKRSLNDVVRRHDSLRTTFSVVDGEPWQRVSPVRDMDLMLVDLSAMRPEARSIEARRLRHEHARASFDLKSGPLVRSMLLRLAEDEYIWFWSVHHIVADGWSVGLLISEVSTIYRAYVKQQTSPLPELQIQYTDYAHWQAQSLPPAVLDAQVSYWRQRLHGAPALLSLPTDRPRPLVPSYIGRSYSVIVSRDVAGLLNAVGQQSHSTLFMVLMAALSVLLWRHGGQRDISVGTALANRNRAELESMVGHFVNTLVIRTELDPNHSFLELLEQVRRHTLDAYANQDAPFEQLVEAINPARNSSYSPLFQVMLVAQNTPKGHLELPGLVVQALEDEINTSKFDLSLQAAQTDNGLLLHFEYRTELFDHTTVERMAGHYVQLLQVIVADPQQKIGDLQLLRPDEHDQIDGWNRTKCPITNPMGLTERFEAMAAQYADRLAVACLDQFLTYGELNRRANQIAHGLRAMGVALEDRVGLCMERSVDMVAGILGIIKAGAAYVPMDISLPEDRLAFMAQDAQPKLVVADATRLRPGWQTLGAVQERGHSQVNLGVRVHGCNLAYVIYTSGSTGRPKGVAVAHAGITNLVDHWVEKMGDMPHGHTALWSSVGFDVSVQEIVLPLTTGSTLHVVPEQIRTDPQALMDWLRTNCIAQAYLPPAFIRWIDEAPEQRLDGLQLRQLLVGVEALSEKGLRRMQEVLPQLRILNGYGPTETSVYSCSYGEIQALERQCPIGRPIFNTQVYLLDDQLNQVPIGVTGEIYIAGVGLARGYLHRPELTAECFIPNPLSSTGERMYRTGDFAHYLPDGNIQYCGRTDTQVKLRGFRIELGEIEAVLRALPTVREAVVTLDRAGSADPRLVAIVGRDPSEKQRDHAEWHAELATHLPAHMLPAAFVELPWLPQTANGKLDRGAIQALARTSVAPLQVNQTAPRDHTELVLYQIWKRLLLTAHIGIRDNFFEIGGTSISAIKMAHEVELEFGVRIPIMDLLLHQSIESLAGRLRKGISTQPLSNLIEFRRGDGKQRVVCIHPAGGTGFCYLSLAKAMPDSCGVYGVQSPGVNPSEEFLPSIEAMAEAYIRLIEPFLSGPLVLIGLSFGGFVAFEMGRRLAMAGHTQVTVVLLDTIGSDDPEHMASVKPVTFEDFRAKLIKFNGMYPGIEDQQIEQYFRIYNHNLSTLLRYVVPNSPVRVVLVHALGGRNSEFMRYTRQFWVRRAHAGFHLKLVHGDHWEMLESKEVLRVARLLRREFDRMSESESAASSIVTSGRMAIGQEA
jgi:amino acid adenylation domain-containing protein